MSGDGRPSYYERNRERVKAYNRAYYAAHREECKARNKAYKERNRERMREYWAAYSRAHYEAHREERIAKANEWRMRNPDKVREYSRKYKEMLRTGQPRRPKAEPLGYGPRAKAAPKPATKEELWREQARLAAAQAVKRMKERRNGC